MKREKPSSVRIKICGITNVDDALCAAQLGADAVGFVFARSPRQVSPEEAKSIATALPPLVQTVGVFVDEDLKSVLSIAAFCHLDLLQFHGQEGPDYCAQFDRRVIKAVRVKTRAEVAACSEYREVVDAFLLDTFVSDQSGGTGQTFDWNLGREAKQYGPIILAGGLHADNVADAIAAVRPYAVDASSRLEKNPGTKDHEKMARFVETVRNADAN
jgi:phosphoribosylanthranilate isomerase